MVAVEAARWDVERGDERVQLVERGVAGQVAPEPVVGRHLGVVDQDHDAAPNGSGVRATGIHRTIEAGRADNGAPNPNGAL